MFNQIFQVFVVEQYPKFLSTVAKCLVAISVAHGLSSAEVSAGEILYSNNFPDSTSGQLNAVIPLEQGGCFSVGKNGLFDARSRLVWLDRKGQTVRDIKLEAGFENGLTSVAATPDGGFVAVGFAQSKQTDWDVFVFRLSRKGKKLWHKTYGGSGKEKAEVVKVLPGGDILIGGWTKSKGAGGYDGWVLRLDQSGHVLWDKTFGTSKTEVIKDLVVTDDGGLVAAGYTSSLGAGFVSGLTLGLHEKSGYITANEGEVENGWVLRLDRRGAKMWDRVLGGKAYDTMGKILAHRKGVVVAGYSKSGGNLGGNAWVAKLDGSGRTVWERSFGEPEHTDHAVGLVDLNNGSIVLGGTTANRSGVKHIWLKTLSPDGRMVRETGHHLQKYVDLEDLSLLSNENIVFVGRAKNPETNKMNAFAISITVPDSP